MKLTVYVTKMIISKTSWRLNFGERYNPALEPDSIMITKIIYVC